MVWFFYDIEGDDISIISLWLDKLTNTHHIAPANIKLTDKMLFYYHHQEIILE